jgi:hypothetical protein
MVGKRGLTLDDIDLWAAVLDIPPTDIGVYFFTKNIRTGE